MRSSVPTMVIAIPLCLISLTGCLPHDSAYFVAQVFADNQRLRVIATERSLAQPFLLPVPPAYNVEQARVVDLHTTDGSDGPVARLGSYDEYAPPVAVRGTDLMADVEAGADGKPSTDVVLATLALRPGQRSRRTLVGHRSSTQPDGTDEYGRPSRPGSEAVFTHSGRHLLVLSREGVSVWDVATGRRLDQCVSGPLSDLWHMVAARPAATRGIESDRWWLTDDLRYVVFQSRVDIGEGVRRFRVSTDGRTISPARRAGDGPDVDSRAWLGSELIAYDRTTGLARGVGARSDVYPERPRGQWVRSLLTAESVDGRLAFLTNAPSWTLYGEDGSPTHTLPELEAAPVLADWDAAAGRIWFFGKDSGYQPVVDPHKPACHIAAWLYAQDRVETEIVTLGQVKAWMSTNRPTVTP